MNRIVAVEWLRMNSCAGQLSNLSIRDESGKEVMWLKDWLPNFLPFVRTALFRHKWDGESLSMGRSSIFELGHELLGAIQCERQRTKVDLERQMPSGPSV